MADLNNVTTNSADGHPFAETMTTSVTRTDEATVLTVTGEVDLATASALESALDAALAAEPAALVIDLTAVSFLASAGMAALVSVHKRAGGTRLVVVADGPATGRQLKMTSLDQVFSLHSTLDDALGSLR